MAKIPSRKFSTAKRKIASSKFPKSQRKIPSRKFAKGTAKIASRKFAKPPVRANEKAVPVRLERPSNERDRQDRLETLMGQTNALKTGSEL